MNELQPSSYLGLKASFNPSSHSTATTIDSNLLADAQFNISERPLLGA